jgi:hypothetical protein
MQRRKFGDPKHVTKSDFAREADSSRVRFAVGRRFGDPRSEHADPGRKHADARRKHADARTQFAHARGQLADAGRYADARRQFADPGEKLVADAHRERDGTQPIRPDGTPHIEPNCESLGDADRGSDHEPGAGQYDLRALRSKPDVPSAAGESGGERE